MAKDGDCGGALVAANNSRFMEHGVHVPAGKQATVEEPPMFRHEDQVQAQLPCLVVLFPGDPRGW